MSRFIDKIYNYYINGETGNLTLNEKRKKKIIDEIVEKKLKDITIPDKKLLAFLKDKHNLNFATALSYISVAERIIAGSKYHNNIDVDKAWFRYLIVESAKEAFRVAREKNDAYSMIQAANIIGKHNNTDKEDAVKILYDKIIPFIPEITTDPSVLGIKPIKNLDKVKQKLLQKYTSAIDIEYEEIISEKEEDISE